MSLFETVVLLASVAAAMAVPYQVTIQRLDNRQPSTCTGTLLGGNMVLTSAQCVTLCLARDIRVLTPGALAPNNSHNVTRILVNDQYNPTTLYPDVALMVLQNATRVALTGARSMQVDWSLQRQLNCTVNFPHNATNGLTQQLVFANLSQPCAHYNQRNLSTCTTYQFLDTSMCGMTTPELKVDHGTPLLCGGYLTGLLSNIVQRPRLSPAAPCPTNATAYYTRFDKPMAEWLKQTVNANRINAAQPPQKTQVVSKWPGSGAPGIQQVPVGIGRQQQPQNTMQSNHQQHQQQPSRGGKKSGAMRRCSSVDVAVGLVMFTVLSYV